MAFFTPAGLLTALRRLGELAFARGERVELFAVGGAVMMLRHEARAATKDLDAVILAPEPASGVRRLAQQVAAEQALPEDWLNDGAKGFIGAHVSGEVLFEAPGITLYGAPPVQLLALKLGAWRDDIDIADAEVCLRALSGTREAIWSALEPFLSPGTESKAWYAFDELWESIHHDAP